VVDRPIDLGIDAQIHDEKSAAVGHVGSGQVNDPRSLSPIAVLRAAGAEDLTSLLVRRILSRR
jgi:hypothetical protein